MKNQKNQLFLKSTPAYFSFLCWCGILNFIFGVMRKGSQRKSFRETKDWSEEPGRFSFLFGIGGIRCALIAGGIFLSFEIEKSLYYFCNLVRLFVAPLTG